MKIIRDYLTDVITGINTFLAGIEVDELTDDEIFEMQLLTKGGGNDAAMARDLLSAIANDEFERCSDSLKRVADYYSCIKRELRRGDVDLSFLKECVDDLKKEIKNI